jgi:16S rRNA processing protein RimM
MKDSALLPVGVVVKPHGIRGKIRVMVLGDDPQPLLSVQEVWIGPRPDDLTQHRILRTQFHKRLLVLELQGLTREKAESLAGQYLWMHRADLPPLDEDEFYWQDLIGLRVAARAGEDLGTVVTILESGSNHVLVCRQGNRETLIPFMEDVVLRVDVDGGTILVELPEGL